MPENDTHFLRQHRAGEVELLIPGESGRVQVTVARAAPGRGGVRVGLQLTDPVQAAGLLQAALARTRIAAAPQQYPQM